MLLPEDFWIKFTEHLFLSLSAVGIAFPVALLMAAATQNHPRLQSLFSTSINALQTIPSLALFAFLIPWVGIGITPAILTLSLYALLPILRNTITGFKECPPSLVEVAQVFGLNRFQILLKVLIPQSLPMIVSGLRTSLVWTIGTATLGAFIGAGGLGDYIARGIALLDTRLLLTGAIPTALLALSCDLFFSRIELLAHRWKHGKR
jgi:osmoprotectant transport system permease protein